MDFRFADFEIDVAQHELRRKGEIVPIEPQVFDLLVHLVRNCNRIVGKEELIDVVWQSCAISEATLSSRVQRGSPRHRRQWRRSAPYPDTSQAGISLRRSGREFRAAI